jgi:Holliday junction resolvasome RuvABC endonuclease subunit
MVVDPSGSHLAYTICEVDPITSKLVILDVGMIWTTDKWNLGQRFTYIFNCLELIVREADVDHIFTEAYFSSPNFRSGTHIIPTINHIMQMIAYQSDKDITYEEISPTAWRKPLAIKADVKEGKKDFKGPTKKRVEESLGRLPEEVISNITGNFRSLPTDIPDALAISLYVAIEYQVKLDTSNTICYSRYSPNLKELIGEK